MDRKVKKYFEVLASDFDSIYHQNKRWLGRLVDKIFRRGMKARFQHITSRSKIKEGVLVLDVGCGSGRYALAFARRGARVIGIDFSYPMLKLARSLVSAEGCEKQCQFICGDFRSLPGLQGEMVLAVGVFDYVSEPSSLLEGIFRACREEAWVTFPKRGELKAIIRSLWLKWKRCPLYFYSYSEVKSLAEKLNTNYEIVQNIEGDYLLHLWRT